MKKLLNKLTAKKKTSFEKVMSEQAKLDKITANLFEMNQAIINGCYKKSK